MCCVDALSVVMLPGKCKALEFLNEPTHHPTTKMHVLVHEWKQVMQFSTRSTDCAFKEPSFAACPDGNIVEARHAANSVVLCVVPNVERVEALVGANRIHLSKLLSFILSGIY